MARPFHSGGSPPSRIPRSSFCIGRQPGDEFPSGKDLQVRPFEVVGCWLEAAAQVLVQESLGDRPEGDPAFRLKIVVSLVGVNEIGHVFAMLLECRNEEIGV